MKEFADNNFEFDENAREISKKEENTVEKGAIACYKQFLLFPQCFQKTVQQTCNNQCLFGKGLMQFSKNVFQVLLVFFLWQPIQQYFVLF